MYKIVPVEQQECPGKTITKNRCKPSKMAYNGHFWSALTKKMQEQSFVPQGFAGF